MEKILPGYTLIFYKDHIQNLVRSYFYKNRGKFLLYKQWKIFFYVVMNVSLALAIISSLTDHWAKVSGLNQGAYKQNTGSNLQA